MKTNTESMLRTMLKLQDAVNTQVNPEWRAAHYPWYRAIWKEAAEMMDHIGWKWWKKQQPDIPQVQLELIDIWHFGLSDVLQSAPDFDAAVNALMPAISILEVDGTSADAKPPAFRLDPSDVETFAESTLLGTSFDAESFAAIALLGGLTFESIYTQYIGKNVLNRFRQDHGYKTGEYIKIWMGREDNEHLVEIAGKLDASLASYADDLYHELGRAYTEITAI